jgi:transcriptional regulator with XRE-family HTH domain
MLSPSKSATDLQLKLASHVKMLRVARSLTQEGLAVKADIALRHIQKIESGEVNVTLETLAKLAHALNTNPAELIA